MNWQTGKLPSRQFVDLLMRDFQRGSQFPHEVALAAIAVALETRYTPFADEYLLDLARLHDKSELDLSPYVAQLCRLAWSQNRPRITIKSKMIGGAVVRLLSSLWIGHRLRSEPHNATKAKISSMDFADWTDDAKT